MDFDYWGEWKESFSLAIKHPQIFWSTLILGIILQSISVILLFIGNKTAEYGKSEMLMSYMGIQIVFFALLIFGTTYTIAGMMNSAKQVVNKKKVSVNDFFKNANKDFWEYLGFVGVVLVGYLVLVIIFSIIYSVIFGITNYFNSEIILYVLIIILLVLFIATVFYLFSRIIFALPLLADFGVVSQGLKFSWYFPIRIHQFKTMTVLAVTYLIMAGVSFPFYIKGVIPTSYELTQLTPQYSTESIIMLGLFFLLGYLSIFITIANQFFIYKSYKLYAPKAAKK